MQNAEAMAMQIPAARRRCDLKVDYVLTGRFRNYGCCLKMNPLRDCQIQPSFAQPAAKLGLGTCLTPPMSLVTPVVVSLCTTATALIFLSVSALSTCSSRASSAPQPHSHSSTSTCGARGQVPEKVMLQDLLACWRHLKESAVPEAAYDKTASSCPRLSRRRPAAGHKNDKRILKWCQGKQIITTGTESSETGVHKKGMQLQSHA